MKRFIHITLVLALIIGFVSCKKDEILNTAKETTTDTPAVKNLPPKQKITLSASSQKPGLRVAYDGSRGTAVTDDNTLWQEGDEIAVYKVGVNGKPEKFTLVDGAGTSYGTFVGNIEPTGNYYGVYPYSAAGDLDGTSISITLPSSQNYAENSFGQEAAVFAATSTLEGSDVVLHFEPLLGYLSLSLTTLPNTTRDASSRVGGHSVGSIVLHENSLGGISLSGAATVDMSSTPQLVSAPTGGGLDVTLNCPSVQLSPSEAKEFIIAVPAGAFSKGLCATVKDPSGKKIMSLATTTPNVITTNYITKLPAQDVFNMEDVEGKRYPVAKIGSFVWMSDNLKTNKYDSNSGEGLSVNLVYRGVGTGVSPATFNPQYHDPTNSNNWDHHEPDQLDAIRGFEDRFGYLYSWAAAVGIANGDDAYNRTTQFDNPRQGICPNGWHVPTYAEVCAFDESIGEYDDDGKYLKSVNGWVPYTEEGIDYTGTDDFGFTALPSGFAGGTVNDLGIVAWFWTSDPYYFGGDSYKDYALLFRFLYYDSYVHANILSKQTALAVRCLKD